jgi:hypothetical protein
MKEGLWHRVIIDKYLRSCSVVGWLRTVTTSSTRGSHVWKYLLKSIHILLHWIAWYPGLGDSILVGRDYILGMGDKAILSDDLILELNGRGVYFLSQASCEQCLGITGTKWHTSEDLGLGGRLAFEWTCFRKDIILNGILLSRRPDELRWSGGNASGVITVKNLYEATEKRKQSCVVKGWRRNLWTWNCPLKLKLFTWLLVENKILTWENLQRRGYNGLGWCVLCNQNWESTFHLFVDCSFVRTVWSTLHTHRNISGSWAGSSIT